MISASPTTTAITLQLAAIVWERPNIWLPNKSEIFVEFGPQADTWALGVITLKLITGQPLFDAKNSGSLVEVYQAVMAAKVPNPIKDRNGIAVPAALQQVIERALEKDPQKRLANYPNVKKFAEDFARVIAPQPVQPTVPNNPFRQPQPNSSQPVQKFDPAYASTVVASPPNPVWKPIQIAAPASPSPFARPKVAPARPARSRRFSPLWIVLPLVFLVVGVGAAIFMLPKTNKNNIVGSPINSPITTILTTSTATPVLNTTSDGSWSKL